MAFTRAWLIAAVVAYFDGTGGRVGAKLRWIHVACTDRLTLYHLVSGRGMDLMGASGVLPGFTGVAVHDGLASYRRYDLAHALCAARHLRGLVGIGEATGQDWAPVLADLLVETHVAVQAAKTAGKTALTARTLAAYLRRYNTLVTRGQQQNPPPARTGKRGRPPPGPAGALPCRLEVYSDDVLRFATDFRIPFDNDQAERGIRMVKLQQKISGGCRSAAGATAFQAVRSYLSTARKHNHTALADLDDLYTGNGRIPAASVPPPQSHSRVASVP